jgi:hypothetical protein
MSMLGYSSSIGVLLAAAALPVAVRAASDEVSISDDASLNDAMRRYQPLPSEQIAWRNPYMPQGSVSYLAPAAADEVAASGPAGSTDPTESADENMARIVAQYDRAMLDRGGWVNSFLPPVAAGNPIVAVASGAGVTLSGTAGDQQPGRSVASTPKNGDAGEEQGAGSGEPEMSPPDVTHQPGGG